MTTSMLSTDILIVGAGLAGLAAASSLKHRGYDTLVIDKSRKIGGRLASKRIGRAQFDYGAQFMTAREPLFLSLMDECESRGLLKQWFSSRQGDKQIHPRWCGISAMTDIAEYLASSLQLRPGYQMAAIKRASNSWSAHICSGEIIKAKAVVLTQPVPQILDLLKDSGITLPVNIARRLTGIKYEKCLAVLATLNDRSKIGPPGGVKFTNGPISWLADNYLKGISQVPAVTIHGAPHFSEDHWHSDRQESGGLLVEAAKSLIGAGISELHVHGWRYAKPVRVDQDRYLVISLMPPLILAGDAFGGPRVEGAAMSGWRAAAALEHMLRP